MECSQKEVSAQPRFGKGQRNFIMVFLQCLKTNYKPTEKLCPVSYSITFVLPTLRFAGRVAKDLQQVPTVPWVWRMLHGSQIFPIFGIKAFLFCF